MRSKVTFILLALNLLLFGYLLVSERPWAHTADLDQNRKRVLGPEAANLAALDLVAYAPGSDTPAETIRLRRQGDAWQLITPIEWPANIHAVTPILTALQFLEHETSFPVSDLAANGQSLADYGLDKPRLVVTATPAPASADGPAPTPFSLRIGDGTAVGKNLYVLSPDGTRIHVVGPALFESLDLGLDQLRSERLFTIPVFEARALTLQTSANSARTRLRRESTRWIFEAPINTRAAKAPVELLVNDLNSLRVARFLADDPDAPAERTGLNLPRFRLTLEGNSRRETLLLGRPVNAPAGPDAPAPQTAPAPSAPAPGSTATSPAPTPATPPPAKPALPKAPVEFYARLDEFPTLFTVLVPAEVLRTLDAAQTELRDPRVLDLDPARVTSIAIAPPDGEPPGELRIQKLDSTPGSSVAWQLASPGLDSPLRADPALVAKLLQTLQLAQAVPPRPDASPFVSDAPSKLELENLGFNRPERTITLQLAAPEAANTPVSTASTLVLELAQPGGADPALYARVRNQPFIYSVSPDLIHHFSPAPRAWRDRTLARLPEATRITRLVLRHTATPEAPPVLDYRPSAEAPPPSVATLLAALRQLRAASIVDENYPATVPVDGVEKPWAYTLEATLEPPGDGPLVLSLAERSGGMTQQAGSADLDLVFTLEQPVLDALWSLLYSPPQP